MPAETSHGWCAAVAPRCRPTHGCSREPTTTTACCAMVTWVAAARRSGLWAIASVTMASSTGSLKAFSQSLPVSPPRASARHGQWDARVARRRLTNDVGVRRRRLQRAAGEHRCGDEECESHQPENGYSHLYQVYERIATLRKATKALLGLV